jgi:3-dehydroquinate synthase
VIRVPMTTSQRSYDVVVGPGLLDELGALLTPGLETARCVVVTDANVAPLYLSRVVAALAPACREVSEVMLPAGEQEKSLSRAQELYGVLYERNLGRVDAVVALGGGVMGDLAGFVAATYQRGMRLVQCPTTLLAQVDAAVGGKVGVDFRQGKNYVGTFYQPQLVVADTATLETLSPRDARNGAAEVAKYGLLTGGGLLDSIEQALAAGFAGAQASQDSAAAASGSARAVVPFGPQQIADCVGIKAGIVSRDEREERGERQLLNLGHTLGHAMEAAGGFRLYSHGEAVGLGLRAALWLSRRLTGLGEAEEERGMELLSAAGLPERLAGVDPEETVALVARDKKAAAGKAPFVLLEALGRPVRGVDVPQDLLRETVAWLQSR